MTDAFAQWRAQVLATAQRLDEIDYFRLLGCAPDAGPADIRKAFRQLANNYHPDRFVGQDDILCHALEAIYRRITEAYAVLRDPADRSAYRAGLDQGLTRYDPDQSQQALQQTQNAGQPGSSAEGRRHYERAQSALARNDRFGAQEEIRMALLFEPSEPTFMKLAKDLQGS